MKILDIYTDGSHLKKTTGRLGCGGILVDPAFPPVGKELAKFSLELDPSDLKEAFGPGAETCSNPTAELTAVLVALREFKKFLKGVGIVTIHADYIGVREWMTGAWRVKEPYIARIKAEIEKEIKSQGLTGQVQFAWVKGHQRYVAGDPDIHWNSVADVLAKGEE
jgi:ribonuclease HI